MSAPPFITFYSFKGGVGRTQAVANVGAQLASRGFRVLLVDFDLEAPGLTWLTAKGGPGVVELLLAAKRDGEGADLFRCTPDAILERYVRSVPLPPALQHDDGRLLLLPAGEPSPAYGAALNALNLGELYASGTGRPLILHLKDTLARLPLDFVLVDSRTGFSDEGGICTRDLADAVVVITGLNRQNREGTASFLSALRKTGRKPLAVALSPVPNGEEEAVDAAASDVEARLTRAWGSKVQIAARLPYHPRLALSEELKFWPTGHALGDAYRRLFGEVLTLVGLQPERLTQAVLDAAKKRDVAATVEALRRVGRLAPERVEALAMAEEVRNLVAEPGSDPLHDGLLALLPAGSWVVGEMAVHLKDARAERWFQRALESDPDNAADLGNYANFLTDVRRDHVAAEEHYWRALQANHANDMGNYARLLLILGREGEARELVERAWSHEPQPELQVELAYYAWAFNLDADAWPRLLGLLSAGHRSPGWNLTACADAAIARGHPEPDRVRAIAAVISEGASLEEALRTASP